jgi:hypothetical protein
MNNQVRLLIERFNSSRHRLWIVIIATLLTSVTTVWPIADDYKAARQRRELLTSTLRATLDDIEGIDRFSQVHVERSIKLDGLDAKTIGHEELQAFRNGVVEIARESGCRVRSIKVGQAATRPWKIGEPVLNVATTQKPTNRDFTLTTLPMHLSIAGDLEELNGLLQRMHDGTKVLHTKTFQLKPAGQGEPEQVILEMDLLLFDLSEAKKETA